MFHTTTLLAIAATALATPSLAFAQDTPALVAAYARQLAEQCGPLPPGAPTPNLVDRIDLNGDKHDDWVVDAGRYPCPGRPALAAAAGAQLTIFRGVDSAIVVPAFQRAAFGSRITKAPDGSPALWVTLGGGDCGATDRLARCERRVMWNKAGERFEVLEPRPPRPPRPTP